MKLKVTEIRVKTGIHRFDAIKMVKNAMGFSSLPEASKFYEELIMHWQYDIEEEAIDGLLEVFDFVVETRVQLKAKQDEEQRVAEIELKREYAQAWFETLSPEHQEFVKLLAPPVLMPAGWEPLTPAI